MRALPTLALAALLASCATHSPPPGDVIDPAALDGRPLRARIVNANGRLLVSTNRPAHVAIFEIVPNRGVGLLYPAYRGENNYLSSGLNSIHFTQSRLYYTYFQPAPYASQGPRYLYMIASDAPLRTSSLVNAPGALRRTLGMTSFASSSPYGLMDNLADLVLPYGAAGDWTDDVYAVWDDRVYDTGDYQARDWIRVRCSDGRVIEGPAYYVYGACNQGPSNNVPPLVRNPEQPDDSSAVKPPTRTRPEPRDPSAEEGRGTNQPPQVEAIPEPEPSRRPRVWTRSATERSSTDLPRYRDGGSEGGVERRVAPMEGRAEPRSEPRRVEPRAEPRSEPRVESTPAPRSEPRVEAPRSEPRVETSRTEARSGGEPPAR